MIVVRTAFGQPIQCRSQTEHLGGGQNV